MKTKQFDVLYFIAMLLVTTSANKVEKDDPLINLTIAIDHSPPFVVIVEDKKSLNFSYSYSILRKNAKLDDLYLIISLNDDLMTIQDEGPLKLEDNEGNFVVVLEGKLPGRGKITFQAKNKDSISDIISYEVFVEREKRVIDRTFTAVVILLVVLANVGMGCKVDLSVVKATLKRPVAPAIGMCSQFIFMPLIGFAMAYTLPLTPGTALGFFALGCSPGGSASNVYTNFLNGNVSLSVTMTLISSLAALGLIPFWLFTLGKVIYSKEKIKIPYSNIITSLIGIVVPIVIGIFLQRKLPKIADFFMKAVKYIIVVFFIFVFTVGIYANQYVFYLISPEVILASALLPYLGFIIGFLFAFVTRQKKGDIIAICLETGIQNTGIPIILCQLSLSGPEKDTSIVSPVVSAIFTPIPIMFAILYVQIKAWRQKRRETSTDNRSVHQESDNDIASIQAHEKLVDHTDNDSRESTVN